MTLSVRSLGGRYSHRRIGTLAQVQGSLDEHLRGSSYVSCPALCNIGSLTFYPVVITAVNDESGKINVAFDHEHGPSESETDTIPSFAKRLKARKQPWALVVDDNYGEGSAREHTALQPRFYGACTTSHSPVSAASYHALVTGCAAIVARSFARIHETNLKVCPPRSAVESIAERPAYRNKASCLSGSSTRPNTAASAPGMSSRRSGWPTFSRVRRTPRSGRMTCRNGEQPCASRCRPTSSSGSARALHSTISVRRLLLGRTERNAWRT